MLHHYYKIECLVYVRKIGKNFNSMYIENYIKREITTIGKEDANQAII